jgi:flagellar basal-body rod modification protein FlgD
MQVGTTGSSSTQQTTATKQQGNSAKVGYDAFLQLLIAQLRHQDPLKPIDSTEYVSQLAQLSNLEQAIQQNEKLDSVLDRSTTTQALSLLGRTVTSRDGSVTGKVVSAVSNADGLQLTLADGRTLMLEDGMRLSQ